eukprot:comp19534_c1_seq1/m.22860 comp19534_c1_seq1/g.22860  ORF comp19534_c1_seq1/g.22860 comp19534_c1_seq1/m.22860 type:complete len:335 (-) comp19534_c1_seq1:149-1153(-)
MYRNKAYACDSPHPRYKCKHGPQSAISNVAVPLCPHMQSACVCTGTKAGMGLSPHQSCVRLTSRRSRLALNVSHLTTTHTPHIMDTSGPASGGGVGADILTAVAAAPITQERPVDPTLAKTLPNPGCPRAMHVVDRAHPHEGDYALPPGGQGKSVLQQHCVYWDEDGDGIIWPRDTWRGFHDLGFNWLLSIVAVLLIHLNFSVPSQNTWFPDPRLPVYLERIHLCKHGSDSEVYDTEGRFVPEKFEELFSKYDRDNKGALSFWELWDMTQAMRNYMDVVGWMSAKVEWFTLYWLCASNGVVSKEHVAKQYNGTLFFDLAQQTRAKRAAKAGKAA